VNDLNPRLQALMNPPDDKKAQVEDGFRIFRVGDRVMQIRNDYNKGDIGVMNGEVGTIAAIQFHGQQASVTVQYPDISAPVVYTKDDWGDIKHAYACTIHKAQGSEYPAVIMVMHTSQFIMLQRNLFYTGLTRARKLCVVAGTDSAVDRSVRNSQQQARNTTLSELLAT
jgi:exodeoxyribonuclease V alpha subunit